MGVKYKFANLADFAGNYNLRLFLPSKLANSLGDYCKLKNYLSFVEAGSRPKGGIQYLDDSIETALSIGGEQILNDGTIDLGCSPKIPLDYYLICKKGKVKTNDILMCKDGALTGKCGIIYEKLPISEVMVNEHVYIIRSNNLIDQQVLFYILRSDLIQSQIRDLAYKKKGQPGLNSGHLNSLIVPKIIKEKCVRLKELIERNKILLHSLQGEIKNEVDIINEELTRYFGFDYDKYRELKNVHSFWTTMSLVSLSTDNRFSYKFVNKADDYLEGFLKSIKTKKVKELVDIPVVLGATISPLDFSETGKCYYISMATIKTFQVITEESQLVSKKFEEENFSKKIKRDDLIIARSGVSIGKTARVEEDIEGIFADFTMRIRLKNYDVEFAYYYFRSVFIQGLINKYKMGVQNQNIYPKIVNEFPLPDIPIEEQNRLSKQIKHKIDEQIKLINYTKKIRMDLDSEVMKILIE